MLMGEGDPDFVGEVKVPVDPARVMYAGLDDWNEVEDQIIRRLQLRSAGAKALAETSQPVLDWIAAQTIRPEPPMWSDSLSPSTCPGTCSNCAMRCASSRSSPDQN